MKPFKKAYDRKLIRYGENQIRIKRYSKSVYEYEESALVEEIKNMKLDDINWYQNGSSELKSHAKATDASLFRFEVNLHTMSNEQYNQAQRNYVDRRRAEVLDYAISNNRTDLLNFAQTELNDQTIEDIVMGKEITLQSKLVRIRRLHTYAKEQELDWFKDDGGLKQEILDEYIRKNKDIPYTKHEIVKRSVNRTYKSVSDLLITNSDKFTHFITLTFASEENKLSHLLNNEKRASGEYPLLFDYIDAIDYEACIKRFTRFTDLLKRKYKKSNRDLYYIAVPEYQKNGNIHYHILCNQPPDDTTYKVPKWLDFDYRKMLRRNDLGMKQWKHGKSTIEEIKDSTAMAFYISKYLLKSLDELKGTEYENRFNKKRYYASNNLDKPTEENFLGDHDVIVSVEQHEYKHVYEKEYTNLFGIKITDTRYSN